jgi:hypothetical protein
VWQDGEPVMRDVDFESMIKEAALHGVKMIRVALIDLAMQNNGKEGPPYSDPISQDIF